MNDESNMLDSKYEEIEQARIDVDTWVGPLSEAYSAYGRFNRINKTHPSKDEFPEFQETLSTLVEQALFDSAWAYFNSNSRVFDPDNKSHAVLDNFGLAPEKMTSLPHVSRLGTYYSGPLSAFQPVILDDKTKEGESGRAAKRIRLNLEAIGSLILTNTRGQCSITADFSRVDEARLRKNMMSPFKSVTVGFSKDPSENSWKLRRGFNLTDAYKDLGLQAALKDHPKLATEEARLLKGLLDLWGALPEQPYKRRFDQYAQSTLEIGFKSRIIGYLAHFAPDFARRAKVGDPNITSDIIEYLINHPDQSNYIQYSLFE